MKNEGHAKPGEYEALRDGCALVDRSCRGLLEVRGKDRAGWLHNLVTNQVKPLGAGDGVYAFALNVQGRILFDLNLLMQREAIWLDIDREFLLAAKKHLEKYHIVEDVAVVDRTEELACVGFSGAGAAQIAAELGAPQAVKMSVLGVTSAAWRGHGLTLVRHDFCGPFGFEVWLPREVSGAFRCDFVERSGVGRALPAGDEAVQVHRIEAGIPWPGREITEDVLPAETEQMGRAVSAQKGCYLGQEIVERMRARGVVARRLVGLACEGSEIPVVPAQVLDQQGKTVGTVTSACHSPAVGGPIALGYLKSAAATAGTSVQVAWDGGITGAAVRELPFVGSRPH